MDESGDFCWMNVLDECFNGLGFFPFFGLKCWRWLEVWNKVANVFLEFVGLEFAHQVLHYRRDCC
jgi:hypothetical protein